MLATHMMPSNRLGNTYHSNITFPERCQLSFSHPMFRRGRFLGFLGSYISPTCIVNCVRFAWRKTNASRWGTVHFNIAESFWPKRRAFFHHMRKVWRLKIVAQNNASPVCGVHFSQHEDTRITHVQKCWV